MSIFKRISVLAGLVTTLVAGGSALVAVPASAGEYCAAGYHCVFYLTVESSKHSYFNSDGDFSNDRFSGGNGIGTGGIVNNNTWAASNSSTAGYESHYYDGFNNGAPFLFCVNPGRTVHSIPSTLRDRASSLRLRGTTSIVCLQN